MGVIQLVDIESRVRYPEIGFVSFTNQVLTIPMSAGGDSGSVVCLGGPGQTARLDTTWGVLELADPDRDDLRVSGQLVHDMEAGVRAFAKYFTQEEGVAARRLLGLARGARGKNAREVLSFLDDPKVYRRARAILARVTSMHDPYR